MRAPRLRRPTFAAGMIAVAMSAPAVLVGQALGGGAVIQAYRFDDAEAAGLSRFRLVTSPFAVAIPLGGRVTLQASGAFAEGVATGIDGAEATLSGLTDTEVGISFALGPDRMILTAGAALPTGQSTHTTAEAAVASIVAAELLPFAVTNWGSGGGVGGDLAFAFQSGPWGIGLAGGYRAANEFEPSVGETFAYRPGNQVRARLAVDRDVGGSGTFSVLLGVQQFGDDQLSGANIFRSGKRFEGVMSYAFAVGLRGSALVYGGAYHRDNGALLLDDSALTDAADSPSQQLFTGGVDLRLPLGRGAVLLPGFDVRAFRSEDGVGQGWISTVGFALQLSRTGRQARGGFSLTPTARYRLGHVVVREGSESDLTGWEAGATLSLGVGR